MITVKDNVFHINTPNSSYIFAALPTGHLATLHYGKRIDEQSDYKFIFPEQGSGYGTSVFVEKDNRKVWPDSLDAETSFVGRGDYREPMFVISDGNDRLHKSTAVRQLAYGRRFRHSSVAQHAEQATVAVRSA